MNKQKLIISLIRDHLINTKLINGLNALGLNADDYSVSLGQTIFELLGFETIANSDEVFEYYLTLIENVNHINIPISPDELSDLANAIHFKLAMKKLRIKKGQ